MDTSYIQIQEQSKTLDIIAFTDNIHYKTFLSSCFLHIGFEKTTQSIEQLLEKQNIDLLITESICATTIEKIKIEHPETEIIIILTNQKNEELKKFLQLNVSAIEFNEVISPNSFHTLQSCVRKISEKKSAKKRILSLEDKVYEFRKLLNVYGENVIASVTDTKGIIKYATQAFCNIGGYNKEDLIGKPHNIIRHPDMPKETFKQLWETIKNGKVWKGEIKNKKKDGGFYWVFATISPEINAHGDLIGYSAIRQDITDKKYIEELSITDSLTSLYNRRHFDTMVELQLKVAKRYDLHLNFLILDIDFFKQYNDTYGHQQGDLALVKVASAIKKIFKRPDDYAFRLGGEEFGVLFFTSSRNDAFKISNNLRIYVEEVHIPHEKNTTSKFLTFSAGLYTINNKEETFNSLYKKADDLLYKAKKSGRNRVIVHEE